MYLKEKPPYAFLAFAKIDGEEITYPVSYSDVALLASKRPTTENDIVVYPPEGYVPVFSKGGLVTSNPLLKVIDHLPKEDEDGYWIVTQEIVPLSIEETDEVLAIIRDQVNTIINEGRLAANFNFFPFRGKEITCDRLSRSDMDGTNGLITLLGGMPPDWIGVWKCRDNTYIPMATVEDWTEMFKAMFDQGQENFKHAQALKTMLANAGSYEEIIAINWNTKTPYKATPLPENKV